MQSKRRDPSEWQNSYFFLQHIFLHIFKFLIWLKCMALNCRFYSLQTGQWGNWHSNHIQDHWIKMTIIQESWFWVIKCIEEMLTKQNPRFGHQSKFSNWRKIVKIVFKTFSKELQKHTKETITFNLKTCNIRPTLEIFIFCYWIGFLNPLVSKLATVLASSGNLKNVGGHDKICNDRSNHVLLLFLADCVKEGETDIV